MHACMNTSTSITLQKFLNHLIKCQVKNYAFKEIEHEKAEPNTKKKKLYLCRQLMQFTTAQNVLMLFLKLLHNQVSLPDVSFNF